MNLYYCFPKDVVLALAFSEVGPCYKIDETLSMHESSAFHHHQPENECWWGSLVQSLLAKAANAANAAEKPRFRFKIHSKHNTKTLTLRKISRRISLAWTAMDLSQQQQDWPTCRRRNKQKQRPVRASPWWNQPLKDDSVSLMLRRRCTQWCPWNWRRDRELIQKKKKIKKKTKQNKTKKEKSAVCFSNVLHMLAWHFPQLVCFDFFKKRVPTWLAQKKTVFKNKNKTVSQTWNARQKTIRATISAKTCFSIFFFGRKRAFFRANKRLFKLSFLNKHPNSHLHHPATPFPPKKVRKRQWQT